LNSAAEDRHEEGALARGHRQRQFSAGLQRDVQQGDLGRRCQRGAHAVNAAQRDADPDTGALDHRHVLRGQYLPKGTDLSIYSQDELDAIADSLNSRPRATHAFHSPLEVFATILEKVSQSAIPVH
jgi:hypothetical protein